MILGSEYVRPFISLAISFPNMLFCTLLFARSMKRRRFYLPRFFAGLLIVIVCYLGAAVMRYDYPVLITRIITGCFSYFVILPLLFLCYCDAPANILLSWCAGFAVQEIASRGFALLLFLAGVNAQESMSLFGGANMLLDYGIYYAAHFLIALLCCAIFHRNKSLETDRSSERTIARLSLFSALWLVVPTASPGNFRARAMSYTSFFKRLG